MKTLKPSEDGLAKIKTAVEKSCKQKLRNVQSTLWLNEASKSIDPNWKENSSSPVEGISLASWNRFRSGKSISVDSFKAFCEVLNLYWQHVADLPPNPFGFVQPGEKRDVFNDYSGDRAIDELWADPLSHLPNHGGDPEIEAYVKAKVKTNGFEKSFLRISFVRQGWGANVTIRPMYDVPVDISDYQYMTFRLKSSDKEHVGIRLRIVDANYVFWGYGKGDLVYETKNLSTASNVWSEIIRLPLTTGRWFHFRYDGLPAKSGQRVPNFDVIQLITFEVGVESSSISGDRCGLTGFIKNNAEEATIDISPIRFE